jgi:hypothetical protein
MTDITASQKTALLKLPGFKDIQKQYAKETKMAGAGKRRMKGKGFWDDVGNWFVQAGKDVNQFLKDSKIVSNVAAYALPILGAMGGALLTVNPLGATAGGIVGKSTADYIKSQGYGATHMMIKGRGNNDLFTGLVKTVKCLGKGDPLAINPPDQRMRGINPKSTMRGKGQYTTADINGIPTLSMLQNRKMRSISMSGEGYGTNFNTMGLNGTPQVSVAPANPGMIHNIGGKGMMKVRRPRNMGMGGTEYGSVSSQFGNVQF